MAAHEDAAFRCFVCVASAHHVDTHRRANGRLEGGSRIDFAYGTLTQGGIVKALTRFDALLAAARQPAAAPK